MTPLAHRILANRLKPLKDRQNIIDPEGVLSFDLASATCFEVSAIKQLCEWQAEKVRGIETPWPTMFLPAQRTWIETCTGDERHAFLLIAWGDDVRSFDVFSVFSPYGTKVEVRRLGFHTWRRDAPMIFHSESPDAEKVGRLLLCILAAINAPKVFARVEHNPHAGLARKLAASKSMPGRYPLHAWHEIKLEGWTPKIERGLRRAKGATGERAQHFVRAHPRFQNGKWVIVKWHRRGNPQLGMKRARYSVQMPSGLTGWP